MRTHRARGFTLVELLAAIVIIALLAALATPSFIALLRDRRVVRSAIMLADYYKEAHTRALSRGNPVLVRWRADGAGKGSIELREVIVAPAGQGIAKGCNTADWSSASLNTRQISIYDFAGTTYQLADMRHFTEAGVETPFADMCFSPEGRTFVGYVENDPFTQLMGVPRYDIKNTKTTFMRKVLIPPNGIARLQL